MRFEDVCRCRDVRRGTPKNGGTLVAHTLGVVPPITANPIRGIKVLIISSDDATINGTRKYLGRAGASARSVTRLSEAVSSAANVHAVLLFADDYSRESAIEMVEQLRRKLTAKIVIVVSEQVESFASIGAGESTGAVTALRRPTWGWMLLDAIRAQLGSAVR